MRGRVALAWATASQRFGLPGAARAIPLLGGRFACEIRTDDHSILNELFASPPAYGTDFQDAIVVDIGGHKGYFAAHAFLNGAARVVTYEPATSNFDAISEARESLVKHGYDWRVNKMAVAREGGTATLHLHDEESSAHSLVKSPQHGRTTETVDVVSISDVLAEAYQEGKRLVVKLDAEGVECEIVLDSPKEAWDRVSQLLVDLWASPCASELRARLQEIGFVSFDNPRPHVLRARRVETR